MESQRALDDSVVMRRLTWEDVHAYDWYPPLPLRRQGAGCPGNDNSGNGWSKSNSTGTSGIELSHMSNCPSTMLVLKEEEEAP